jgi:flagellar protein FlaF
MRHTALAQQGYARTATVARSPRRAEADVFRQVTGRMKAHEAKNGPDRIAALHDNRRLWIAAAVTLADDGNGLPPELRAQLLGLAGFVERHTAAVLRGQAEMSPLIEINHRVHEGLSGQAA